MTNPLPEFYPGMFDAITMADFEARTTTATGTMLVGRNEGKPAFQTFVQSQLDNIRSAYIYNDGGPIDPIAVLADVEAQHVFGPDESESFGQYVQRLAAEAKNLGAHWVFISRRTEVAAAPGGLPTDAAVTQVDQSEGLTDAFYFYAMTVENGVAVRVHGHLAVATSRTLGDVVYANPDQLNSLFDTILG